MAATKEPWGKGVPAEEAEEMVMNPEVLHDYLSNVNYYSSEVIDPAYALQSGDDSYCPKCRNRTAQDEASQIGPCRSPACAEH